MASSIISRRSSLQAQTQSKSEVLQWVSFVLGLKVTKLEQVRQQTTAFWNLVSSLDQTTERRLHIAASEWGAVLPNHGCLRRQSAVAEGIQQPHVLFLQLAF